MPEKDDKYYAAKADALEAKVDALQATIGDLKMKKAAGKLDAVDQVKLDEGEQKLAELKAEKAEYIQIAKEAVKAGSGVAATDYSDAPLYSQTVKKYLRLETSGEQYGFYASSIASVTYMSKSVFRAYHLLKASQLPVNAESREVHMAYANAAEHQVKHAQIFARRFATRGIAAGLGVPLLYAVWFGSARGNLRPRSH